VTIKNRFFYGYWIVLAGFATLTVSTGLAFYGFSVLNKPIADEFGWSRGEVTAAFFAFMMAMAIVSPLVGQLTDKRGPRQILILGAIVMPLALVLLSKTSALWNYYLLHLWLGIGYVLLGPVPISIIVSNWFYRWRGTMQGLAFTGIGFGGLALAPLIGNYLIPNLGWRSTYLVMALLLLVTILPLTFFVVRDQPRQKGFLPHGLEAAEAVADNSPKIEAASGLSLKQVVGTSAFWLVVLTSAAYGMSQTGALQNQVSILTEQTFTTSSAVFAIGIVGLFSAVGKFLFGWLCDHIDPKYAAAIAYFLIALSLVTMIQARSMAYLWLYAVLMGLGQGGWAPNLAMLAGNYFGLKHYGAVLGAIHLIFFAGEAVGPMIIGFAYDYTGSYRLILTVLVGLCLASIPLIAIIRKPQNRF